jgi:uncharacterized membrane protein YhhN
MGRGDAAMRRLPSPLAFILVALASFIVATLVGVAGAFAGAYFCDGGSSKGNDLAVALIGFHAAGTFTFVSVFPLLWSRRGNPSWRVPVASFAACLCVLALDTMIFWSSYDAYSAVFFYAAWLAVAFSGSVALVLSRYTLSRAARENSGGPSGSDSL